MAIKYVTSVTPVTPDSVTRRDNVTREEYEDLLRRVVLLEAKQALIVPKERSAAAIRQERHRKRAKDAT